jgi:hypothetical protein
MIKKIEEAKPIIALAMVLFLISLLLLLILPVKISLAVYTGVNTVNGLPACVVVPSSCVPGISNTLITFPSNVAGGFDSTSNDENVMNYGNLASHIYVDANAWTYLANSFAVGNTLWSATSGGNIGTQMTGAFAGVDTSIPMKANGGNDIYFGLNIPAGQTAATYSQTINILTSCTS